MTSLSAVCRSAECRGVIVELWMENETKKWGSFNQIVLEILFFKAQKNRQQKKQKKWGCQIGALNCCRVIIAAATFLHFLS